MASLRLGPLEIGIILVIVLIVFGVGKLPQVGDALGKGIRAFRKGQSGEDEEDTEKSEAPKSETAAVETPVAEKKPESKPDKTESKTDNSENTTGQV